MSATTTEIATAARIADLIIAKATTLNLTISEAAKTVAADILNSTDKWTEKGRIGVVAEVAMVAYALEAA